MSGQLLTIIVAYLALIAALGILAALGVPCGAALRSGVVIAELLLITQLVIDCVTLARGHRPADTATHLGYAVVSVILFPILLGRASRLPSRADNLVAVVAASAAIVVSMRLHATWASS